MKTIYIIIFTIGLSLTSLATDSGKKVNYFICHFTESVDNSSINDLKQNGFKIINTSNDGTTVYVQPNVDSEFSTIIKAKVENIIGINDQGTKTPINIYEEDQEPDFLKLFFNFL